MLWVASIVALAMAPWFFETYLFRKNLFLYSWWFLLPVSIGVSLGGTKLNLPSELLLVLWLTLPLLKGFGKEAVLVLKHPISWLLVADLLIYFFASLNSTMPTVSLKRFIIHSAYVSGAYFLMVPVLLQLKQLLKMSLLLSAGLLPVLLAVLAFQFKYHFNSEVAPASPRPFFADHTLFGAFAAFLLPLTMSLYNLKSSDLKLPRWTKFLFPIAATCIAFSFSRAVWMSVAVMAMLYLLIRIRVSLKLMLFALAIGFLVLYTYRTEIYQTVLQNEAESDRREVLEQIKSVGNVKTDVSNLERINRWKAAYKMFAEKPWLGFGPGTYQFQYAPYQELRDKTVISTNFGDAGNAHSEYLMYLAETGIFGFLCFVGLCLYLLNTGFRLVYRGAEKLTRQLALGVLLGLSGFLVHSLVNSFLETDKIGLLFYFFIAALVALDLKDRMYKSA